MDVLQRVAPCAGPGIGIDLSPKQELALLARILHRLGYDDGLSGHITVRQGDGTFLTNPFAIGWDEICASHVATADGDGNQVDGPYVINKATELHFALHRARHVEVAIHNHPRWTSTWSSHHRIPPCYDQTSAAMTGTITLVREYDGVVADPDVAKKAVAAVGDADIALLANHGVLVTGANVPQALWRARVIETRSRNAWQVEAMGAGGEPLSSGMSSLLEGAFAEIGGAFPHYFEYMARREIAADYRVLD